MSRHTAAEWFISDLQRHGVEFIATLCGHGQDPLFDAARRAGLRLVDTRNEQTAGYIAECYGRLTRKPGVCSVSSGVAVVNGMTGLLNAWYDRSPMLMISGSADMATLGMGCFQDMDAAELARPIAGYSRMIDHAPRVRQILGEAWRQAQSGPAHLMFPMDMQRAEVAEPDLVPSNTVSPSSGASPSNVDRIARALLAAERPLVIATSHAYYSGEGTDMAAMAQAFSIPVQTPIWDRGCFDGESSEVCMGVVGSATGGPTLMEQSDCIVFTGPVNDYRVGYLQGLAGKSHVLGRGWRALRERFIDIGGQPFPAWLAAARGQRSDFKTGIESLARGQMVEGRTHALHVMQALADTLPPEAVLVIDAGSIGQWAHQWLTDHRYPGHWLTCGRSGVVGYGIGGAMAARLAFPGDRPVVLLSGDGSFTFAVADLECAARQGLHFTAIVADDRCWGITHTGHVKQFGQGMATELGPIRFDMLAQSLGCDGRRIDTAAAIAPALRESMAARRVSVLHVPISGGNPSV